MDPSVTEEVFTQAIPDVPPETMKGKSTPGAVSIVRELWAIVIQFNFLMIKHFLIALRSPASTCFHIFNPIIFLVALYGLQFLIAQLNLFPAGYTTEKSFTQLSDFPTVPSCTAGPSGSCHTVMAFPGNADNYNLMKEFMTGLGKPLDELAPPNAVLTDMDGLNGWLSTNNNRNSTLYIVHITQANSTGYTYTLQYDRSFFMCPLMADASSCTDHQEWLEAPMMDALDTFFASKISGKDFKFTVGDVLDTPHPARDPFQVFISFGPMCVFAIFSIHLVIFSSQIVQEKESRIRAYMKIIGLRTIAYWASFICYMWIFILLNTLVLMSAGYLLGFYIFTKNNLLLLFIQFMLYGNSMIALSIFIASLVSTARSASLVSFAFLMVTVVVAPLASGILFVVLDDKKTFDKVLLNFFETLTPLVFFQGLNAFNSVSSGKGTPVTWSGLEWEQTAVRITVLRGFWLLSLWSGVYFIIAMYLDSISSANGVGKPLLWPILPWEIIPALKPFVARIMARVQAKLKIVALSEPVWEPIDDEDVLEEVATAHEVSFSTPLCVQDLVKRFRKLPVFRTGLDFVAVKGLNLTVRPNELLCLLGPNGAGKTTTISMLSGQFAPTAGDAYIYGHSITNDMPAIRKITGVCPQHDIIFENLTAAEHIRLFSAIKGLSVAHIRGEVAERLEAVNLEANAGTRVGNFSGGMRRRMSIAIALIGSPGIVFLDEPTTGLDPVVRSSVWEIIMRQKEKSAIVLTTHSMEEADVLGDRIAIMAFGRNRCIGTSIRLKSRFGAGYTLTSVLRDGVEPKTVLAAVQAVVPEVELARVDGANIVLALPKEHIDSLAPVIKLFEGSALQELVSDLTIELSSLEDVFIKVAETSIAEENAAERGGDLPDVVPTARSVSQGPSRVHSFLDVEDVEADAMEQFTESVGSDDMYTMENATEED